MARLYMKEMQPPRCYPSDLAARVRSGWPNDADPLAPSLEKVLDTAYHASFLREEERAVACRIALAAPNALVSAEAPPNGLLSLEFAHPRTFDEHELRRLSPAVKYHRALIGVCEAESSSLVVWGFVQTGPRWLASSKGGRGGEPAMPRVPIVRVIRPGHIAVSCGSDPIAELRGGRLMDITLDCFTSRWLPERFAAERSEVANEHIGRGGPVSREDAGAMTGHLAQQMLKRVIATMRAAHHGGALVFVPPSCTPSLLVPKYSFRDASPRRAFRLILHSVLAELVRSAGIVNAETYRTAPGRALADLDEALFEMSHLIASLADVDGAVVLTRRFELLGFGAEIVGSLPLVADVRRALDVEADEFVIESTDAVGTRHRSAYRLCAAVPEALAIVVSQDGGVRFVANHRGAVTYWDHGPGDE
jgi:hypothetical protein